MEPAMVPGSSKDANYIRVNEPFKPFSANLGKLKRL